MEEGGAGVTCLGAGAEAPGARSHRRIMKGKSDMSMIKRGVVVLGAVAVLCAAGPAIAQIDNIQTSWIDATQDTTFDGTTLLVSQTRVAPANPVAVNEATFVPSTIDQYATATVNLTTDFDHVGFDGSNFFLVFTGGTLSVTFANSPVAPGWPGPYEISGPINALQVRLNNVVGGNSFLDAEGLFMASTTVLPGSGIWSPGQTNGTLYSSIDGMIINLGEDLSGYDWATHPAWTGVAQTQFQMIPDDTAIPEPASLALLAAGMLLVVRRR